MITAERLFAGQSLQRTAGACPAAFTGIARDSRHVAAGAAYVAIGNPADQPVHAAEAVAAGAAALISELPLAASIPLLGTPHARWAFARASAALHGLDRLAMPVLGVTGTAGKSTTTHCAWWALGGPTLGAARIGTIGWHDGANERANPQTTPPPEELHAFLAGLPSACPAVAMEVSSHAGDQHRLAGLRLAGLAYTGLGHDHLDYHRTVGAYLAAKLRVARLLRPGALCVVNADDPHAHVMAHAATAAGARVIGLGHLRGEVRLSRRSDGWRLRLDGRELGVPMRLPGDFNAWNAAAGALLASAAGVALDVALDRLATLPAVPGRLELLAHGPDTYVDYAHTPEELSVMLRAVRREFPGRRLVCVFGCGGDRDRTKRGPMGCAALEADVAVLTTDNSRSESPLAIANDVLTGLPAGTPVFDNAAPRTVHRARSLVVELDRAQAIILARDLAGTDGIVVVAGKGHETNQLIQGRVLPWDDRAFVADLGRRP